MAAVVVMILLLAGLLSSCGQPSETGPTASGYAPPQAVSGEHLSISYLYPGSEANERLSNSLDHLQKLLSGQGWNVTLALEGALVDEQSYRKLTVQTIRADIAAGNAADGYIVTKPEAQELLSAGLTQDLTGILPTAAPALYSRCGQLFTDQIAGIPLGVRSGTFLAQTMLFLQKNIAAATDAKINAMSDVLTFLERNDYVRIGGQWTGFAYESLLSAWAGEQGYYPLEHYGLPRAELYASYSDPQCKPVPIEGIPGFDDMFLRGRKLWTDSRIVEASYGETIYAKDVVGYVGFIGETMDMRFLIEHNNLGIDYIAFPLVGCSPPTQRGGPVVASMLAVPVASTKAGQLAAFAQWALTDRHNYDLVSYGAQDMDYRLTGERVEYLNNGNALSPQDLEPEESTAFFMHSIHIFNDSSMERLTVYSPDNYQSLQAAQQTPTQPLWDVFYGGDGTDRDIMALLRDGFDQYADIIDRRYELLNGMEPGEPADCLAKLHAMAGDTGRIVDACSEKIALMMMERGAK